MCQALSLASFRAPPRSLILSTLLRRMLTCGSRKEFSFHASRPSRACSSIMRTRPSVPGARRNCMAPNVRRVIALQALAPWAEPMAQLFAWLFASLRLQGRAFDCCTIYPGLQRPAHLGNQWVHVNFLRPFCEEEFTLSKVKPSVRAHQIHRCQSSAIGWPQETGGVQELRQQSKLKVAADSHFANATVDHI